MQNKANFALTAGNDEFTGENSKTPGTFERINLYYLSVFANSAENAKQSQLTDTATNVNLYITTYYDDSSDLEGHKNKPNQSQFPYQSLCKSFIITEL